VTVEIPMIQNNERLQNAVKATRENWLPIVRMAYDIPGLVTEPVALAAISSSIESHLSTSDIAGPHCPAAACLILAATLELLASGKLDPCLLPRKLAELLNASDPVARIVSQSGVSGTSSTKSSVNAAAKSIFDHVVTISKNASDPRPFAFVF
jgi:hypothetical protein